MNKLFQNLANQVGETIDAEFGIADETGMILACTDESKAGYPSPELQKAVRIGEQSGCLDSFSFFKTYHKNKLEYIIYIKSDEKIALKYLSLISLNVLNLKSYHEEKFDKTSLIQSIILGRALPGEILSKAKELHVPYNAYRAVLLVRTEKTSGMHAYEIIQGLFPNKARDFAILLDDANTVLVKELKSPDDARDIEKTAHTIIDTLNAELMVKAFVGTGTVVDNIKDIYQSYVEAKSSLIIGAIFDSDRYIYHYNSLGIGRLIYQIPQDLCKLFLKEVFKEGSLELLDSEMMHTIQSFFENSLNVSETSRKLYVHRNTLVYRLDKIQKITGLDLRRFDDAIIFKVAILVKKYLARSGK